MEQKSSKSAFTFLFLFLSSLLILSCKKETKSFSCNPEIDKYVKANAVMVSTFDRATLGQMRADTAVAILHFLSGDQKYKLWKEKFELEMKSLSPIEREYYSKLTSKHSALIFTNEKERQKFENFAILWAEEVKEALKWSDEKIFYLTNVLATESEIKQKKSQDGTIKVNNVGEVGLDGATCYCYYSISCDLGKLCIEKECGTNYKTDCGIGGSSACIGRCE
ncbi:bacteriocin fulvocin C-related protein [Sediminibacterium sp.]|jgi:hypothetical protein|nr:bacteriocin fulvocin C-related protein [Sediminibacterium sp.]